MDTTDFPLHPVCSIFPRMKAEEFQQLKADIEANGQHDPITLWQGQVIDGRHRLQACRDLGQECDWQSIDDEADPVAFAISANLHRRHLSPSQRSMIAARVSDIYADQAKERQKEAGKNHGRGQKEVQKSSPPIKAKARDQAGESVGVSGFLVDQAKTVIDHGSEELQEMVDSGEVSVSKAAKVAKTTPKEKQVAAVSEKQKARDAIQAEREAVEAWVNRFGKFGNRMYAVKELIAVLEPTEKGIVAALCEE